MKFEEIYGAMKEYFESGDFTGFGKGVYSYEFDVTGEGEGRFYMEVRDGVADVQPFDYRNSLCSFVASSDCMKRLIDRRITPTDAYSTGRLTVRGDVSAAFRLADVLGIAM